MNLLNISVFSLNSILLIVLFIRFVVVFLGESGVGKTCLATRYEKGTFASNSASTIGLFSMNLCSLCLSDDLLFLILGAAFSTTTLELNGALVKIQMWDTGSSTPWNNSFVLLLTIIYYSWSRAISLFGTNVLP